MRDLLERVRGGVPGPVQAFVDRGEDFATAERLGDLVEAMNTITGGAPGLELERVEREVISRDREMANPFTKDLQVTALRGSRRYLADRFIRTAAPHRLLDPKAGPLIAVRLSVLTRKTLGGLQTDLDSRALDSAGEVIPGLYAAGEIAGFGGGGMHGYRSLEGTFLGGCLFSGRAAGRHAAGALG
jgi:predicted oxidoreductase